MEYTGRRSSHGQLERPDGQLKMWIAFLTLVGARLRSRRRLEAQKVLIGVEKRCPIVLVNNYILKHLVEGLAERIAR